MGIQQRQVREIRTHSSILKSGTHSNERHVHQFQLASLELERTRRGREKQAALRRVATIDARLAEIEELIRKHQEALGVTSQNGTDHERPRAQGSENSTPEKRRVLRY
ncbi:MAG TPA: hypothetical protein VEW48_09950 [Thermoanaerobaculia bacterium]|nr:hypothetical protein [Thermoanaerobaculia bacterium]